MTRAIAAIMTAVLLSSACDRDAPEAPAQPTAEVRKQNLSVWTPPPERLALPLVVVDLRTGDARDAGTSSQPGLEDVPLRAVGLNQCQTGYVLQPFYTDEDGALRALPPLPLPRLVEGGLFRHTDPALPDQAIVTRFETANLHRLRGTLEVVSLPDDEPLLRLEIDAEPISIATGPGLGALGCFTTGEWTVADDGRSVSGPASAVWDNEVTYWIGASLDEHHSVEVWLTLQARHRRPQNLIRGDLRRVAEAPEKFPFRVVFVERREDGTPVETPAETGQLTATFARPEPEGPVRVELTELSFPKWNGPLAGTTVESLRLQALFVTDLAGSRVPIPGEATGERGEREEADQK